MYDNLRRLHAIIDRWLEKYALDVDYLARARPGFEAMRERLNDTPGLIICNRAGGLEPHLTMRILERRQDGLLVANGAGAELVGRLVGVERVIAVSDDLDDARRFVRASIANMERGGFCLLFPTGKADPDRPQPFKGGFRLLLKRMQPEWMVYGTHMHPDDAEDFRARMGDFSAERCRQTLATLEEDLPEPLPPLRQRFDERWTTVAQWREAMGDPRLPEANERLTRYYASLFPVERRGKLPVGWPHVWG